MKRRPRQIVKWLEEGKILTSSGASIMKDGEEVIMYGVPKMFIPSVDGYGYLLLEDDPEIIEHPGYVMIRFSKEHPMYKNIDKGSLMKFADTTACCKGIIKDKKMVDGKSVTLLDENSSLNIIIDDLN